MIDAIGDSDEPKTVFCVHDCDPAGTVIYESLQEATRIRPRRNLKIIDLGLNPAEARDLIEHGILQAENSSYKSFQGVADDIDADDCEWLQEQKVELNAFTTREFIAWLDEKIQMHGEKLVPPPAVLANELDQRVQSRLNEAITNRVLAEARVADQVREARARLSSRVEQIVVDLPQRVAESLRNEPSRHWAVVVEDIAKSVASGQNEGAWPNEDSHVD